MKYDETFRKVVGMLRDGSLTVASIAKATGVRPATVKHVRMVKDMPSLLAHMQNSPDKEIPVKLVVALDAALAQSANAYEGVWAEFVRGEWKPARRVAAARPAESTVYVFAGADPAAETGAFTVLVMAKTEAIGRARMKMHMKSMRRPLKWRLVGTKDLPTAGVIWSNVEEDRGQDQD